MKQCSQCKDTKTLKFFHKSSKYGTQQPCKECKKEVDKKYRRQRREYSRSHSNPEYYKSYYLKDRFDNPEKYLLAGAKKRAKKKGLEFSLSLTDICIPEKCPILGIPLRIVDTEKEGKKYKPINGSPSIDRLDNTKGYTQDNILVCSYRANMIKNCGTLEEHKKIVEFLEQWEKEK